MQKTLTVLLALTGLVLIALPFLLPGLSTEACREINKDIALCVASDMAKLPNRGPVPLEHQTLAVKDGPLRLNAARNETIAFQLLIQNRRNDKPQSLELSVSDLRSDTATLDSGESVEIFQAWYHYVDEGGYSWGPKSEVLDWPEFYPDALVPRQAPCNGKNRRLFERIAVPAERRGLQALWVDIYIPRDQAAGSYAGQITASLEGGERLEIPIQLQIWPPVLPDKPSFDAVGEVYRAYRQEGVGVDFSTDGWRRMAHCYQILAHRHRMVFIERSPAMDIDSDWAAYDRIYQPILDGTLFNAKNGYTGPGENTAVSVWRTPWPQDYDVELKSTIDDGQLKGYQALAAEWSDHAREMGWENTDFFAYIFDEVDGPDRSDKMSVARKNYLTMAHQQMNKVQQALDAGSGDKSIDLIWTSHSNPIDWLGIDGLDLAGIIRLWAPNAHAASPLFLSRRRQLGEKIWFYHSGHPAVGVHSINASGIEMRTWGVISARYGFDGQLMWAVNLGNDEKPFARPSYKDDDDRFGNGVMVYPGNKLDKIGFPASPGPIPSMRLKSWRRGLQDAELALLAAKAGKEAEVRQLLQQMIPAALADAEGDAQWPDETQKWIDFHLQLLQLASADG